MVLTKYCSIAVQLWVDIIWTSSIIIFPTAASPIKNMSCASLHNVWTNAHHPNASPTTCLALQKCNVQHGHCNSDWPGRPVWMRAKIRIPACLSETESNPLLLCWAKECLISTTLTSSLPSSLVSGVWTFWIKNQWIVTTNALNRVARFT